MPGDGTGAWAAIPDATATPEATRHDQRQQTPATTNGGRTFRQDQDAEYVVAAQHDRQPHPVHRQKHPVIRAAYPHDQREAPGDTENVHAAHQDAKGRKCEAIARAVTPTGASRRLADGSGS